MINDQELQRILSLPIDFSKSPNPFLFLVKDPNGNWSMCNRTAPILQDKSLYGDIMERSELISEYVNQEQLDKFMANHPETLRDDYLFSVITNEGKELVFTKMDFFSKNVEKAVEKLQGCKFHRLLNTFSE